MAKNIDDMFSKIDEKLDEVVNSIHKVDKELAIQKSVFDAHTKQDEHMYEELKRMNDTLSQNTASLQEHMQQTQLLKETVLKIDARLAPIEVERIKEEAVRKYRNQKLKKYGKIIGVVATAIGILAATKPLLLKLLGL